MRPPRWTWSRFQELGVGNLLDVLTLRARVFVVEQQCPYQDPDASDCTSWHLLGRDDAGTLVAYLRVVDPGYRHAEPAIGRVVTAPEVRAQGQGRALMAEGLARCLATWPGHGVRLNAQSHLERFYGEFGFVGDGEVYLEDDIPHLPMWRAP